MPPDPFKKIPSVKNIFFYSPASFLTLSPAKLVFSKTFNYDINVFVSSRPARVLTNLIFSASFRRCKSSLCPVVYLTFTGLFVGIEISIQWGDARCKHCCWQGD